MDEKKTKKLIQMYVKEKKELLDNFPIEDVFKATEFVWDSYLKGGIIYGCGNGGNASYVGNMVCDFSNHPFVLDDKSKTLKQNIERLTAIDLTSSKENITGILNDFGPDYIFSRQLINHKINEKDLVIGFTGSGNSGNILQAFETARKYSAKTIAITRGDGGKAKELSDVCIILPATSNFPGQVGKNEGNFHYEDTLSSIPHIITGILRERISKEI